MSRVRSDNYEVKRQAILDAAAVLFAKAGFPNAKMEQIGQACGATKSMLYHYFPTKEDLLFSMLDEHLDRVLNAVDQVMTRKNLDPQVRFADFVQIYTQKSTQSRQRHIIAMNDAKFLPRELQVRLIEREVRVTNMVAALLRELNPNIDEIFYKPYTLLLIGMLNWTDTWYKPSNKITPQGLCDLTSRLFLRGFLAEKS
ncbi:MAG: TetR/AcrR family transcriptional regulator [Sulfuricaulis sp.]|nr:TetR/AcrR family transcriptional regulator [Sulfuricaulis sp.]